MTRSVRRARLAAALLVVFGFASAQSLTLDLDRDRRGQLMAVAQATDSEGAPITRHEIRFFLLPDFFPNGGDRINGMHAVPLGSDTSDATGTAERRFEAPFTGPAELEARLIDASGTVVAATTATFDLVREGSPQPAPIATPLAAVRGPIEIAILVTVVTVWLLLLTVFVGTLRSIRVAGRNAPTRTQT